MINAILLTMALNGFVPAKSCTKAEFRQFDFWLGDWEVTLPDGKVAGTNKIESILGGCVLQESWAGGGLVRQASMTGLGRSGESDAASDAIRAGSITA